MRIYYTIDSQSRVFPCCDWQEDITPSEDWRDGNIPGDAYEEHGIPLYKDVEGIITPRSVSEIQNDIDALPEPEPTEEDAISAIQMQMASIASVESSMRATQNYTVGQLLFIKNVLYKVTSNIGKGCSIVVGRNVVATTLTDQIKEMGE